MNSIVSLSCLIYVLTIKAEIGNSGRSERLTGEEVELAPPTTGERPVEVAVVSAPVSALPVELA